jgi:gluconolactonase
MRVLTDGLEFPEGPVVLPDGNVAVVEVKGGTVAVIHPTDGILERIRTGGGPAGAALGPDGKLYVCNSGGFTGWQETDGLMFPGVPSQDDRSGTIQVVDLRTGEVSELYRECDGHRLNSPNDLVFDAQGGLYFTDYGRQRGRTVDAGVLYYAKSDGSAIVEVAFPMTTPNGVGLSPEGDRLYVAETITSRLWTYTVEAPGRVKEGVGLYAPPEAVLYSAPGLQPFDSLAVEAEGNICVATTGRGGITVVSPDGQLVEFVKIPGDDPAITNIAFGGPDLQTAYICSAARGRLLAAEWPRPGLKVNNTAAAV